MIRNVTFTGVDAHARIPLLPPNCEIGVLFTAKPEGRNRYPSRSTLHNLLTEMKSWNCALHVCGREAKQLVMAYMAHDLTHLVQRIQLNGTHTIGEIEAVCEMYSDHEIITQHTQNNIHLLEVQAPNHAILVDASGGRGLSPGEWVRPDTKKRVGYAGGIGPDNIREEHAKICAISSRFENVWIDMEGKLRDDDDWFDYSKAWDVMRNME
jgi:phosphoribosylanthranilate isomerase